MGFEVHEHLRLVCMAQQSVILSAAFAKCESVAMNMPS